MKYFPADFCSVLLCCNVLHFEDKSEGRPRIAEVALLV